MPSYRNTISLSPLSRNSSRMNTALLIPFPEIKYSLFLFTGIIIQFLFSCNPGNEIIEAKHTDGTPKVIGTYHDSIKTREISYYPGGVKEMEGSYNKNLERNGQWTYWFSNGNVWSECDYKNGLKDGKSTVYFENGQKRYEGYYRNDTTAGTWKFWNENGNLVKEINY